MSVHIRFVQVEMYAPNVTTPQSVKTTLGGLIQYCRSNVNIGLCIAPYNEPERAQFSATVLGLSRANAEQTADALLNWVEANIEGQTLAMETQWL